MKSEIQLLPLSEHDNRYRAELIFTLFPDRIQRFLNDLLQFVHRLTVDDQFLKEMSQSPGIQLDPEAVRMAASVVAEVNRMNNWYFTCPTAFELAGQMFSGIEKVLICHYVLLNITADGQSNIRREIRFHAVVSSLFM